MRIRQVRPEFWSDPTLAVLPDGVRLFYIGLWNVADDAGWLIWDAHQLGALLYPYRSARRRERDIASWSAQLIEQGRLQVEGCGCALVPTLSKHQRITGKQAFPVRDKHRVHTDKQSSLTESPGTLGNVKEGNVKSNNKDEYHERMAAAGVDPDISGRQR